MECPESIEKLAELEQLIPLCKVTLYEQAQARLEKNPDKSERQVSKEIAEELGRKPSTIRRAIQREATERMATVSPLDLSQKDKQAIEKHARIIRQEKKEKAQAKNEELKQNACPLSEAVGTSGRARRPK